jgi:hypothetical protein
MIPFLEDPMQNEPQPPWYYMSIQKSLQKLDKKVIKNVLSRSTMHGLSRILKSHSTLLQLMWLLFLLTSVGLFIKFSLNSISNYLDYEVTTKIRKNYEMTSTFPTISICNKNKFTTDFGIETIKNSMEYFKSPDLFNVTVLTNLSLTDRYREADNAIFRAGNRVTEYSNKEKKKLGHSIGRFSVFESF